MSLIIQTIKKDGKRIDKTKVSSMRSRLRLYSSALERFNIGEESTRFDSNRKRDLLKDMIVLDHVSNIPLFSKNVDVDDISELAGDVAKTMEYVARNIRLLSSSYSERDLKSILKEIDVTGEKRKFKAISAMSVADFDFYRERLLIIIL